MKRGRVLDDRRTHELMEAFEAEAPDRWLSPSWARLARLLAAVVSVLALYYAMAGEPIPFTNARLSPNMAFFGFSLTMLHIFWVVLLSAALILSCTTPR